MPSLAQVEISSDIDSTEDRVYCCFCQKLFVTYPGIYQHLKSKHPNLFPTYKKRKIKKMLRKSRDSTGTYIYRLVKLPDSLINSLTYLYQQKKVTENHPPKPNKPQELSPPNNPPQNQNLPLAAPARPNKQKKVELKNAIQQKNSKNPAAQGRGEADPNQPYMNYSEEMGTCPPPFFHYPSPYMFPYYPPVKPEYWITVKALLVRFLHEAPDFDKELARGSLYELMVFIDKNYHTANDPRIAETLFLSYCDEFDPYYLGPLISGYISSLQAQFLEKKLTYSEGESKERMQSIESVKTFALWLDEARLLKLDKKEEGVVMQAQGLEVESKEKVVIE